MKRLFCFTNSEQCEAGGCFTKRFVETPVLQRTHYTKVKSHVISLTTLCPSTSLCLLYGPLSPLRPSLPLCGPLLPTSRPLLPVRPFVPSAALCPLYGPLSPLRPSVSSTALCPLYDPLSPLRPSIPSTAFTSLSPFYKTCFFILFC